MILINNIKYIILFQKIYFIINFIFNLFNNLNDIYIQNLKYVN